MSLSVRISQIPRAGMGLFTDDAITSGNLVVEYTGEITSWDKVKDDWQNVYIYFITEDHVINARDYPESYARYANDAAGLTRVKGLVNNCEFSNIGEKVFIKAIRDISAGEEILVGYGEDYWETIKRNST